MHLRGKPGTVEEIPKGLEQKIFSSHIVNQELEERWALGKRLGRESSLWREAACTEKNRQRKHHQWIRRYTHSSTLGPCTPNATG